MKSLIWKEWREARLIPVAVIALFVAINLLWMLLKYPAPGAAFSNNVFGTFNMAGCLFFGAISFLLAGVVSASSSFSGEIGSNSISFLTALPFSRTKIWATKVAVGVFSLLLSIVGVIIAAVIILTMYAHIGAPKADIVKFLGLIEPMRGISSVIGTTILASVGCFAVSLTVSLLVDRVLASVALSIVACLGILICLVTTVNSPAISWIAAPGNSELLIWIGLLQVLCAFFAASWYIFVQGETLRTKKRFLLLGNAVGAGATTNAVTLSVEALYHAFWL